MNQWDQKTCCVLEFFDAAALFTKTEGILPAPESAHAICGAIQEAVYCREVQEQKTILFGLSGHSHFDLGAYALFLTGKIEDYDYPAEKVAVSLQKLPKVSLA